MEVVRRKESDHSGQDTTMPTVSAGEDPPRYPARCRHCGEEVTDKRDLSRHMTQDHPA